MAVSRPRRRWSADTVTTVTPAVGTVPPGTVIVRVFAAQVATQRSPTVKPNDRSHSGQRRFSSSQYSPW